jgi:hypothetical protein
MYEGEQVPVSQVQGALVDKYFQLLATCHFKNYSGNLRFTIIVGGSSDVGKKALLDRVSMSHNLSQAILCSFYSHAHSTIMATFYGQNQYMTPHNQNPANGVIT